MSNRGVTCTKTQVLNHNSITPKLLITIDCYIVIILKIKQTLEEEEVEK